MAEISRTEILAWGRSTLIEEADALRHGAEVLGDGFYHAVTAILACSGKVILTGLGKSGHIARKIAATLASTGTPAFFLHPSEALHGDFGSMDQRDILIAVGFNGETREVNEVAKYARRLAIKVFAITGSNGSTLAKLSDHMIDARVNREACPLNLAPTSSTTLALALGDALAVALIKARGFQETDFAQFHPEGALGRKLSLVSDHMHRREALSHLAESDDFTKVLQQVTKDNFGISPVLVGKRLVGVVTDGDLRRAVIAHREKVFNLTAAEIMSHNPKTISSTALAVDAFRLMEEFKVTALFATGHENPVELRGLVRMHDLLAAKIV